jgi:hypothetical protein
MPPSTLCLLESNTFLARLVPLARQAPEWAQPLSAQFQRLERRRRQLAGQAEPVELAASAGRAGLQRLQQALPVVFAPVDLWNKRQNRTSLPLGTRTRKNSSLMFSSLIDTVDYFDLTIRLIL